ncbi:hypothetical protein ACLOJK_015270, partial [Asimina triloba]
MELGAREGSWEGSTFESFRGGAEVHVDVVVGHMPCRGGAGKLLEMVDGCNYGAMDGVGTIMKVEGTVDNEGMDIASNWLWVGRVRRALVLRHYQQGGREESGGSDIIRRVSRGAPLFMLWRDLPLSFDFHGGSGTSNLL